MTKQKVTLNKYWFKPKRYGYGFMPITWEGWIATIVLIGLVFLSAYTNGFFSGVVKNQNGFRFVFDLIIILVLFTIAFKGKVRGGLQWKWGK